MSTPSSRAPRCRPQEYAVTRADLVRYAGASGDRNPIHWSDRVATSVGLPGVIAHGMFTMALAARALDDWAGAPGRVRELGCKFTKPVVVPDDDDGVVVRVGGTVKSVEDGRAAIDARGDLRRARRCSACRRPSCSSTGPRVPEPLADHTTLRLGGPAEEVRARPRTEDDARRRRGRGRRRRPPGRSCSAAAATSSSPTRASPGLVVDIATRGCHRSRRDTCGGAFVTVAAGEGWDELVARAVDGGLGRHRGAVRHPRPGRGDPDPERRRLRPGGRGHDRPGPHLGPDGRRGPHVLRRRAAGSATAPAGSSSDPDATSCCR